MKQPLTHGLVLGKFAPLHKGHEYLIETALREMDRVTVMIYHCSFYPIPLSIRANWIRTLYPQVEVLEAWDGPESCGDTPEIKKENEDYILSFLGDRKITHFYCSEFYGEHVSAALHAVDRRVDEARATVPISATEIRKNPFCCRKFLSNTVYRDLIVKVVFVGAMSTGKSTIAEALAKRHHTTFAPEYGREYWTEHQVNRRITLEAFDEIAIGHLEREEQAILAADRYCFIDTNAITTYMFSLDYHGRATPLLTRIAEENARRYDLFFLCEDDIPYDDTWDRSGDQKRHVFHRQIIADLEARRIPYIPLKGSLEARMEQVDRVLETYVPYSNFYGNHLCFHPTPGTDCKKRS